MLAPDFVTAMTRNSQRTRCTYNTSSTSTSITITTATYRSFHQFSHIIASCNTHGNFPIAQIMNCTKKNEIVISATEIDIERQDYT